MLDTFLNDVVELAKQSARPTPPPPFTLMDAVVEWYETAWRLPGWTLP